MLELLRRRRSVRKFKDKEVSHKDVELLKEALLRSPSSRGRNPWRFAFVKEKGLIEKLAASKAHGSAFISGAPLIVAVYADISVSDVWIEDCSIASIILQLAALDMGIDSCWVQIRGRKTADGGLSSDYVKGLLKLDDNYEVESLIALGEGDEEKEGHDYSSLDFDKIIEIN